MRDRTIILDINSDIYKILKYKQFDSNNSLKVIIKDNNEDVNITKYQVSSYFELPNGIALKKECTIIDENTIEIMITSDILSQSGMVSLEIKLISESQVVTLFRISLVVEESINRNDDVIIPEHVDFMEEIENMKEYVDNKVGQGGVNEETLEQINKNTNDINTILGIIDEPPIYTTPTLSVSLSSSNIEHNKQTNITIIPRFTQNDAGSVVSYSLNKNGVGLYTNSTVGSYTDTVTLQHGESITYNAVVTYGDGIIKETLLGIEYPSTSIKAGSISNNAVAKGYALSYYGIINSNNINNVEGLSSVLRTSKGSTLTFDMTNQRVVYMYPKSFGNLTSIKDSNNFEYINSYTLSSMTLNNVEYNVYILTDAVTINGFKQIFN